MSIQSKLAKKLMYFKMARSYKTYTKLEQT